MSISKLDVLRVIVDDQRHYFNFDEIVTLREIYGPGFWLRMDKDDLPKFGVVFNHNCRSLGFRYMGHRNGICTYKRIR